MQQIRQATPWLASGPAALDNEPLPWQQRPINQRRPRLWKDTAGKLLNVFLRSSPAASPKISTLTTLWARTQGLSLPLPRAPPCLPFLLFCPSGATNFTFLTSRLQRSFPCLSNLFPKPISSTNYFCYLCDLLNTFSLGSELFPNQTQILRLLNPRSGLTPPV